MEAETTSPTKRTRLWTWSYRADAPPPLSPGQRQFFACLSHTPFEAESVRVPRGVRVVEVTLGEERYQPGPDVLQEQHTAGVDVSLAAMGARRVEAGDTVAVLLEAAGAAAPRCHPVLLGKPLERGLPCLPLAPVERTEQYDLGSAEALTDGVCDIETHPVGGRIERLYFRSESLNDLDLVDLRIGKDSQLVTSVHVPLGLFADGLDMGSCDETGARLRVSFRIRNRGARTTLAIDADVAPPVARRSKWE